MYDTESMNKALEGLRNKNYISLFCHIVILDYILQIWSKSSYIKNHSIFNIYF